MTEKNIFGSNTRFIVRRDDLTRCDFLSTDIAPLQDGQILLKLEKFGLTSNNVTYAALSKVMPYFEFFPVPNPAQAAEWGNLPVWGIGRVVESKVAELPLDTRVYGYFPAANYATLTPTEITPTGFKETRTGFPPQYAIYSTYNILAADGFNLPEQEDAMVVFRPLFLTGLLLADYLTVQEFRQANTVIISSASSKTSYGLAAALRSAGGCQIIGLASAKNTAFAESLEVYDAVFSYEDLANISPTTTAVYVDVAGNLEIRDELLTSLGSRLKLNVLVGMTHLQEGSYGKPANSAVPSEIFFAPGWIAQRSKELGAGFFKQLLIGWRGQMAAVEKHFQIRPQTGQDALQQAFLDLVEGRANPAAAYIISL